MESKLLDIESNISNSAARMAYRLVGYPLEKALMIDGINRVNIDINEKRRTHSQECNYFDAALRAVQVTYSVSDEDLAKIPIEGPVVCVANHPFGGVDGLILGSILASARPDTRLLVNYMLGSVEELRDWTIEVNPFGTRRATAMNYGPLKKTLKWLK